MRFHSFGRLIGIGLCATLLAATSYGATTTRSVRTIVIPARAPRGQVRTFPAPVTRGRVRPISRHGRRFSVPTCTGSGPGSFVGGVDGNVAAGPDSGVLSGRQNDACYQGSAIGAGFSNGIGGFGPNGSSYAFIGAGASNAVVNALYGFIGAGIGNTISNKDAFVGAGEANNNSGFDGAIVGGNGNIVSNNYGFIGAGGGNNNSGNYAAIVGGNANSVSNTDAFIGAGGSNFNSGPESGIVGGTSNNIDVSYALIGAGQFNTLNANDAAIGAGFNNLIDNAGFPNGSYAAFIGAGKVNTIKALSGFGGAYGVLSGGYQNLVEGEYGAIGGGQSNTVTASSATVGGGFANHANGGYATVPGGNGNTATGAVSFAAGHGSYAAHSGAFVWSDNASGATQLKSSGSNQFLARASGGVAFYSNATLTTGVMLGAGSGTWGSVSDRAVKTDVAAIDDAGILDKVASLPISKWSYISERGVRHLGPMAQDFYAAFGVGEDNKHITSIDENGVALAAIKALHNENRTLRIQLTAQKAQLTDEKTHVANMERQLQQLSAAVASLRSH